MKKTYEAPSADVVKFEAQDVITASGGLNDSAGDPPSEILPDKDQPVEM